MASTAIYSSRQRASERVGRIRHDLDRTSGYSLSNMATYQHHRATGRDSSLVRSAAVNYSRDTSLPRMSQVALPGPKASKMVGGGYSSIMPLDNGLGSETAKYNREHAMKEIHDNFMKTYKDANNKIRGTTAEDTKAKAYTKALASPMVNEDSIKRHCISEMFMETNKFSTKTLAAVTNLENVDFKKKKDYNWRKTMEEYESSGQMDRDKRARNIASAARRREMAAQDKQQASGVEAVAASRSRPTTSSASTATPDKSGAVASRSAARSSTAETAAPAVSKSWRERMAENKQKDAPKEQKISVEKPEPKADLKAESKSSDEVVKAVGGSDHAEKSEDVAKGVEPAVGDSNEADEDGMKKMRKDFFANMHSLDEEMEAGRSKLAKLRERIKRAKMALKEADDALVTSAS